MPAGDFSGAQPVSIYLQNLLPETTYHYRLLATDAAGTAYGTDETLTTGSYPVSAIRETPVLRSPPGKKQTTAKIPAKKRRAKSPRSKRKKRRRSKQRKRR